MLSDPPNNASPGPRFATRLRYSSTGVSDLSQLVSPTEPRNGEVVIALQILRISKNLIFIGLIGRIIEVMDRLMVF